MYNNEAYRQLIASLNTEDVSYALLRDDLASEHPIKDLDILLDKKQVDHFHCLAAKHGFYLIKDGYLNPGKRVYLKVEEGRPYILDVHESIVYQGIEFLDSGRVLKRRRMQSGFYRLTTEDFLLSLLFHN
ncbi:MAG: hypothetical protein ACE5I1_20870, partial [bacterium]